MVDASRHAAVKALRKARSRVNAEGPGIFTHIATGAGREAGVGQRVEMRGKIRDPLPKPCPQGVLGTRSQGGPAEPGCPRGHEVPGDPAGPSPASTVLSGPELLRLKGPSVWLWPLSVSRSAPHQRFRKAHCEPCTDVKTRERTEHQPTSSVLLNSPGTEVTLSNAHGSCLNLVSPMHISSGGAFGRGPGEGPPVTSTEAAASPQAGAARAARKTPARLCRAGQRGEAGRSPRPATPRPPATPHVPAATPLHGLRTTQPASGPPLPPANPRVPATHLSDGFQLLGAGGRPRPCSSLRDVWFFLCSWGHRSHSKSERTNCLGGVQGLSFRQTTLTTSSPKSQRHAPWSFLDV